MKMKDGYEVHSNYGYALFSTEQDAINALTLLAAYHDIKINNSEVKKELRKIGHFSAHPLVIIK